MFFVLCLLFSNNSKLAMIGREERVQVTEKAENKENECNQNNNNTINNNNNNTVALVPCKNIPINNIFNKTYTSISNKTNNDNNNFGFVRRGELKEQRQPQEQIAEGYEKKPSWWLEFSEKDID